MSEPQASSTNRGTPEVDLGATQLGESADATHTGRNEPGEPVANAAALGPASGHPSELTAGQTVGPYRLVSKLGEGGMGAVWKAVHEHLEKTVALKILPSRFLQRPEAVARFRREMKAAGRVTHPHVVQAFDAGETGGVHYLAIEFVDGADLFAHVRKKGPLPVMQAARALRQAALGLAAAHAEGLVHRDIKPQNLLVSKDGKVKVLDLGLARLIEEAALEVSTSGLTADGQVMGTPDYMAPEQWEDVRAVGPATDLYALGCTLYFLLTGKPPFTGEAGISIVQKMKAHVQQPPPDLAAARPDAPPELCALYQRLMAKRAEDRPASAAELAEALIPFTLRKPAGGETANAGQTSTRAESGIEAPLADFLSSLDGQKAGPTVAMQSRSLSSIAANEHESLANPTPQGTSGRRPPQRWWLTVAGALGAMVLLGGIWITITREDGSQTHIPVPDGATVEITQEGRPVATIPQAAPAKSTESQPPAAPALRTQRQIAEAVVDAGGTVTVWGAGSIQVCKARDSLPSQPFVVKTIHLEESTRLSEETLFAICHLPTLESFLAIGAELTPEMLRALRSAPLQQLYLTHARFPESDLGELREHPTLRELVLSATQVTDSICADLATMPRLRDVRFDKTPITNAGLKSLAAAQSLRSITLGSNCSAEGLAPLESCSQLRMLNLKDIELSMSDVPRLARLSQVGRVWLNSACSAEVAKEISRVLPDTIVMHPALPPRSDEATAADWALAKGATVMVLSSRTGRSQRLTPGTPLDTSSCVYNIQFPWRKGDATEHPLTNLQALEYLTWPDLQDADGALKSFQSLKSLFSLQIAGSDVTDVGLRHLGTLHHLQSLSVAYCKKLSPWDWEHLAGLPDLFELNATGCEIGDEGFRALAQLPSLYRLILTGCSNVTADGLAHLASSQSLIYFWLNGTSVDDETLKSLHQVRTLRYLNVSQTNVTETGIEALKRALPECAIFWDGGAVIPEVPVPEMLEAKN